MELAPNKNSVPIDFLFKDKHIRVIMDKNNQPWFVALDICGILQYKNATKALKDNTKGVTASYSLQTNGGMQDVRIINESNLYRLIMRSKMKLAEEFQDHVVEVILPCIRKTGVYMTDNTANQIRADPTIVENLLKDIEAHKEEQRRSTIEREQTEQRLIMEKTQAESKARELEEKNEQMKRETTRIQRANRELISRQKHNQKNQNVYITSTYANAKLGLYKIGRNSATMTGRMSAMNTSHPAGDDMVELLCVKTYCAASLEYTIHKCLEPLRAVKNREFFHAPYNLLKRFVERVADNHELAFDLANEIIEMSSCLITETDTVDWLAGINEAVFNRKCLTINFSNGTTNDTINVTEDNSMDEIKDKVNKLLITYISRLKGIDESEVVLKDTANDLIIDWKNFQSFMKTGLSGKIAIKPHKKAFADILDSAHIKYLLRSTRFN